MVICKTNKVFRLCSFFTGTDTLFGTVSVDETTLPVINKESHKAKKEYLWMVRAVMKKLVFFYYNDGSRSQETVGTLLKSFTGYLQSDGWQAYNVFDKEDQVCLVGCMAHIRRYHNFN